MRRSVIRLRHSYLCPQYNTRRTAVSSSLVLCPTAQFYPRRFNGSGGQCTGPTPTAGTSGKEPEHNFAAATKEPHKNNEQSNATPSTAAEASSLFSPSSTSAVRRRALPPSEFPERSLLKCIEKEIEDETLRLDKEEAPPPPPPGWEMYHAPGTSLFYGRRWWLPPTAASSQTPATPERHTIRVQLTTRDPSLDPECDVRGEHFPFSFFVQRAASVAGTEGTAAFRMGDSSATPNLEAGSEEERGLYEQSIEVRADFVDGELVIDNVVFHGEFKTKASRSTEAESAPSAATAGNGSSAHEKKAEGVHYNNILNGYPGPNLDEAEEEVLDGLQAWLAERCVDDQFGEFVGQYSVWVEQQEYERWLRRLRDFIAA
uniref:Putative mitochondrial glycoprotein-like protein n=1 Tax=Trypanosoma congolense (strain IL3000) TaxID=1068625 RepID=G0UQV1_TRYCI|nr:putative mitochondrial glycoprotein-like protein [Trypanosoma congolense IL3000]